MRFFFLFLKVGKRWRYTSRSQRAVQFASRVHLARRHLRTVVVVTSLPDTLDYRVIYSESEKEARMEKEDD